MSGRPASTACRWCSKPFASKHAVRHCPTNLACDWCQACVRARRAESDERDKQDGKTQR